MSSDAAPGPSSYKQLSLQQLQGFCAVCRRGSYAAAARELLLTTPAVWEQLRGLERHLGLQLLERRGGGVRPTLHGQRLLKLVRPLLAGLESARDILHQEGGALPERLTVVSNLRVLADEISQAVAAFRRRFPSICVGFRYTSGEEVEPLVLEGDADVALTLEPRSERRNSASLAYEPAGSLEYLLVTPPKHALARAKTLRLESVVRCPLVLADVEAYSRQRVQEVFHRHDLIGRMQVAVETSSDEYTLACVRAGLGVGITVGRPRSLPYRGLSARDLSRWFGTARIGFLWRGGAHVPPIQRELAELIRSTVARD